ncbi:hypothetical protein HZB60_11265 [candidate division KSB1 bacterium]|nr:hypothetical protein [candidate division KSB1 bacterium]
MRSAISLSYTIPLPRDELIPRGEFFAHASDVHGRLHVARVLVHALRLIQATGNAPRETAVWGAAYLHDLGRAHDGYCRMHGQWSMDRFRQIAEIRLALAAGGASDGLLPAIEYAVVQHCLALEPAAAHPHYLVAALLKDADALDRVRLGQLDPRFLRFPESHGMIRFAERLYRRTDDRFDPHAAQLFSQVWDAAQELLR